MAPSRRKADVLEQQPVLLGGHHGNLPNLQGRIGGGQGGSGRLLLRAQEGADRYVGADGLRYGAPLGDNLVDGRQGARRKHGACEDGAG